MRNKYRIVVYEDFHGKIYYKPQVRESFFDTWHFHGSYSHLCSEPYDESYDNKEKALEKIEEWKLYEKKINFKNKIIEIIKNL